MISQKKTLKTGRQNHINRNFQSKIHSKPRIMKNALKWKSTPAPQDSTESFVQTDGGKKRSKINAPFYIINKQ